MYRTHLSAETMASLPISNNLGFHQDNLLPAFKIQSKIKVACLTTQTPQDYLLVPTTLMMNQ